MNTHVTEVTDYMKRAIDEDLFVRFTLGKYRGKDVTMKNIYITPVEIKNEKKLSFLYRYTGKDTIKNFSIDEGVNLIKDQLGNDFLSGTLFSTEKDITLEFSKKRKSTVKVSKPTYTELKEQSINRAKHRFIQPDSKFLKLLGISTEEGVIKKDRYDKYRQIDKFIEITDALYRESSLQEKENITILDMGSGKSYLTFALYEYFKNSLKKDVCIAGIELKDDMVILSNKTAEECGYVNLKFVKGDIQSTKNEKADIVVALHACDTATDDAIANGINNEAEIIITAPCCQKYLRKKLTIPEHLKSIYKHGILEERLAVSLTDGLRALVMEYYGYKTKVFEFISSEHTDKNIMVTGVKGKTGVNETKKDEIEKIKQEYGLEDIYLDKILNLQK